MEVKRKRKRQEMDESNKQLAEESTKKRKANSPVVQRGKGKREEEEENMSEIQLLATPIGLGSANGEYESSTTTQDSYLSAASQFTKRVDKPVRKPVFTTKKPEGAFRDEIVVEIQSLDQQPFKGTITPKEARQKIF